MMWQKMVVETLVYSPSNHLTRQLAQESFIEFIRREKCHLNIFSWKLQIDKLSDLPSFAVFINVIQQSAVNSICLAI